MISASLPVWRSGFSFGFAYRDNIGHPPGRHGVFAGFKFRALGVGREPVGQQRFDRLGLRGDASLGDNDFGAALFPEKDCSSRIKPAAALYSGQNAVFEVSRNNSYRHYTGSGCRPGI